jgi:ABC-2 type transport system permease protein
MLIGLLQMILVFTAALVVFQVPFRGSVSLLITCALLFVLTTLGAGLFIST